MEFEVTLPSENFKAFSGTLDALSHFGELVSLEARNEQFLISTFNNSRTAQGMIHVSRDFFKNYKLLRKGSSHSSIKCTVSNKNFNSILKKNMGGIKRIKECQIQITQGSSGQQQHSEARIFMKLVYRNGVTKKNTLWYNEGDSIMPFFQQNHVYKISCEPGVFKIYMNKFDARVQELALTLDPNKVTLSSHWDDTSCLFGERPVKSSFIIQSSDFSVYQLRETVKLVVNLKEFKTIVDYIENLESLIVMEFTEAGRPLLFRHFHNNIMLSLIALQTLPEHLYGNSPEEDHSYASINAEDYTDIEPRHATLPASHQSRQKSAIRELRNRPQVRSSSVSSSSSDGPLLPHSAAGSSRRPPPQIRSSPSSSSINSETSSPRLPATNVKETSSFNNTLESRVIETVTQPATPPVQRDTLPVTPQAESQSTENSQDQNTGNSQDQSTRQQVTSIRSTPRRMTTIERIRLERQRLGQSSPPLVMRQPNFGNEDSSSEQSTTERKNSLTSCHIK